MAFYIVSQMRFVDRATYDRYQSRFMGVFRQFKGQVLAADEHPSVVEGKWDAEKIVILEFPDEAEAGRFATSPEYQEIAVDRIKGTQSVVLFVQGYPSAIKS
jgi:uncharacterized protein (DUF1330 family)